jgi:hypothetical protein
MPAQFTHIEGNSLRLVVGQRDVSRLHEDSSIILGAVYADSKGRRLLVTLTGDRQMIFRVGPNNFRADHSEIAGTMKNKTIRDELMSVCANTSRWRSDFLRNVLFSHLNFRNSEQMLSSTF